MFNVSILHKLRILFFIILVLFTSYIFVSYQFTVHQENAIAEVKEKKSTMLVYHKENLLLFEQILNHFRKAMISGELDELESADLKHQKVIKHLERLRPYDETTKEQKNLLAKLVSGYQFYILECIAAQKILDSQKRDQLFTLQQKLSTLFKQKSVDATREFNSGLKDILIKTNQHFNLLVLISIFGLLFLISSSMYIYLTMKGRFDKVTNSLYNLIQEKPDFSKKMVVERDDEIGKLVAGFNQLQTKLETNYTKMHELKVKAEDTARIKSQFLANMSHEIRTPMNGIVGMSYLVLQTKLTKRQRNYIEKIDNSAKILLGIINDILDLSKIESGKLRLDKINFSLVSIVNSSLDLVRLSAKKKDLKLGVYYSKDVPKELYGDSLRISQVLNNLLSNAVKFTEKGYVSLHIDRVSENCFRFAVEDSGIGIQESQQSKLFKAFSQMDGSTTRNYGGTGLGLKISKQLAELMNGRILVESVLGQGSRFILEIELTKVNTLKQEYQSRREKALLHRRVVQKEIESLKGRQILLVDDNVINQEIVAGLLENSQVLLDIASNGKEAVEQCRLKRYDAVLMDIQMPVMDGYTATKMIRQEDPNVIIIAMTANAMQEDVQKSFESGMNDHINKPVDVAKLYKLLVRYIAKEESRPLLEGDVRAEMFEALREAIKSRRPKRCQERLEAIEAYALEERDYHSLVEVEKLIKSYQFNEALDLI